MNRDKGLGLSAAEVETWPTVAVLALDESIRGDFDRKVSAIKQYLNGASLRSIKASTGISRQHLYYLLDRCATPDEDGRPIGYVALILGQHIGKPRRNSPAKLTSGRASPGALQSLFARYPDLRTTMFNLIVHGSKSCSRGIRRRDTWSMIHETFAAECEKLGICAPNYPFSSESQGFPALVRWGRREREAMLRKHQHQGLLQSNENGWLHSLSPPSCCYERVQCDGHFVDVNWIIEAPSLTGEGFIHIKVQRMWLIALLESKSSAVLGYGISLGQNYSAADVARAIRCSLVPWKKRALNVTTIAYKQGECLPNAYDPKLAYVCFDELWLDNARSHQSDLFLSVLERTVNAVPVFGPKAAPNVRPQIEMVFDLLEEAGIHVLAATTGSNPKDPRKSAAKNESHVLKLEVLLDIIDLLIVRYNSGIAPGTTISRLEVLKRAAYRSISIFRRIPESQRDQCFRYDLYDMATIGHERGRPILRWKDARYFGPGLVSLPELIGQRVLVMANSNDLRFVELITLKNGKPLGTVEVERRWRNTAHSLSTRQQVRKVMTNAGFQRHAADLPIALREFMENEVRKGRAGKKRILANIIFEQEEAKRYGTERTASASDARKVDNGIQSSIGAQEEIDIQDEKKGENAIDNDEFEEILRHLGPSYR